MATARMQSSTRQYSRGLALLGMAAVVVGGIRPVHADESAQLSWQGVERVIAFADVHGAYSELTALLQRAGVVDTDLHWNAGRTHVVSLGDLLDRGDDSRKVMDLLMRLQQEAAAAGGRLHVTLGNHEAMNLLGDLRYVSPGEFASYVAEEPVGQRDALRTEWLARSGPGSGAAFDQQFPPGYFGHRAALAPGARYGQWLLAQPVALVINDTLFMHGGPSALLAGKSLPEINLRYRTAVSDYLGALESMERSGLVRPEDPFAQRATLAKQRLEAAPVGDNAAQMARAEAVQRFVAADGNPWLEREGPNWYRGAALCNACSEADILNPVLEGLGVGRLVIGHTVARTVRVASRFDGRVIKLDAGMNREAYHGHAAALLIEKGEVRVIYGDDREAPREVPAERLHVSSQVYDEGVVEDVLARGAVTITGPRAPGVLDAVAEVDGRKVPAIFLATTEAAVRRELAAYRLDRLLQLGLVPATVAREVQGQRGLLQARPARWVTQAEVVQQSMRGGGWCAIEPQYRLMYAYDALIGNEGRTQDRILYDATEWMLLLTGHGHAFGTSRSLPAYLEAAPLSPGSELRRRLGALDDSMLETALGDLLSERERKALLARRDVVLATAATTPVAR